MNTSISPADWQSVQATFFARLQQIPDLLHLYDFLPDTYVYVKDQAGYFLYTNRFGCQLLGVQSPADVLGKNDFAFFPPAIAAQYVEEDRRVLSSGTGLFDQVWLVPGVDGFPRWYLCHKIPLRDQSGQICGLAGLKRPYEQSPASHSGYSRLLKVVEFVTDHFAEPIDVQSLAEHVELSVSQLQREFSRLFGISPNRYLREVRIGVARRMLETSDRSLSQIASDCGFYDQSHFSRQFKESTGLPPLTYRKRYQPQRAQG